MVGTNRNFQKPPSKPQVTLAHDGADGGQPQKVHHGGAEACLQQVIFAGILSFFVGFIRKAFKKGHAGVHHGTCSLCLFGYILVL